MRKELRKKLWKVALFLIIFNLLAIPMYLAIWLNLSYPPLQTFLSDIVVGSLKSLDYRINFANDPRCNIPAIIVTGYKIDPICISWDCTGWKPMYLLFALTIATPVAAIKGKAKFLAVGLPLIFVVNFVRILTTILVAIKYDYRYFEVVHTFLWREGLIFIIIILWYIWLRKGNIIKKPSL